MKKYLVTNPTNRTMRYKHIDIPAHAKDIAVTFPVYKGLRQLYSGVLKFRFEPMAAKQVEKTVSLDSGTNSDPIGYPDIESLGLASYVLRALSKAGITSTPELIALTQDELSAIKGISDASVSATVTALGEFNLKLKEGE